MDRVPLERKVLSENDRVAAESAGPVSGAWRAVPEHHQFARLRQDQSCWSARWRACRGMIAWPY